MLRKTILAFSLFMILGWALTIYIFEPLDIDWGHHFTFQNQLGVEIDSLEISIGDQITMIYPTQDSVHSLQGKVKVPETGYVYEVIITVYQNGNPLTLTADPFTCFNCDGYHQYVLKGSRAKYEFLN